VVHYKPGCVGKELFLDGLAGGVAEKAVCVEPSLLEHMAAHVTVSYVPVVSPGSQIYIDT
jgi:hypothetical protein